MNRSPLAQSRQGTFYVPLVVGLSIGLLLFAYVQLVQYFSSENDAFTREIGQKQGAIMNAVVEGERVHSYVAASLRAARAETISRYACGTEYLGKRLVTKTTCADTISNDFNAAFTERLARYPSGNLASSVSALTPTADNDQVYVTTVNHRIPIDGGDAGGLALARTDGATAAGGTFSGSISGWPTDSKVITSYFGKRTIDPDSGSINHPGMDIRVSGVGAPITSLTDGKAQFFPSGVNSYVQVISGPVTIEYFHTNPAGMVRAGTWTTVKTGEQIATAAAHPGGEHLHLQVSTNDISGAAARAAWPSNTGSNRERPAGITYAVISEKGRALLNPICFFDRAFIDAVPRGSVTKVNDPYEACHAYEQQFSLGSKTSNFATAAPAATASTPSSAATTPATPTATNEPGIVPSPPGTSVSTKDPSASKNPKVVATYQNLGNQPGVLEYIKEAADREGVDPVLMLSIITQESEGKADAVSPTGAAGIGQFTGDTAKAYFTKDAPITYCCTEDEAERRVCNKAPVTKCNDKNDARFDPKQSIDAKAKLLAQAATKYAAYDQQLALILIRYNAGEGVANQILKHTGPNPTWTEIRNVIQNEISINYGKGVNPVKKRVEVVQYVETITQDIIPEWGGATLSGSGFSPEQVGFYELKLQLSIDLTPRAALAVDSVQQALNTCTSWTCVTDTMRAAEARYGVRFERELLEYGSGCLSAAERTQALLANQLAWCASSPDDECACPLAASTVDAKLRVSAQSVTIEQLGDERITRPAMPGLAGENGDGTTLDTVSIFTQGKVSESEESFLLHAKTDGTYSVDGLLSDTTIPSLRKSIASGGLALSTDEPTDTTACILPESFKPRAYCITTTDGSAPPLVIYIQTRVQPESLVESKQYRAETLTVSTTAKQISFLTNKDVAYAQVRYTTANKQTRDEWYRAETSARSALQLLGDQLLGGLGIVFADTQRKMEHTTLPLAPLPPNTQLTELYQFTSKPQPGEEGELILYDEHLNVVSTIPLDTELTKEESGIVIPNPTSLVPGAGAVGGVLNAIN